MIDGDQNLSKRFYSNSYENNAYNTSTFELRDFNVPVEPMPETSYAT